MWNFDPPSQRVCGKNFFDITFFLGIIKTQESPSTKYLVLPLIQACNALYIITDILSIDLAAVCERERKVEFWAISCSLISTVHSTCRQASQWPTDSFTSILTDTYTIPSLTYK